MSKDFTVGSLPIPKRLLALIDSGFWPRTSGEERQQILHPLVTRESILLVAPEEERIYFVKPPFHTVARRTNGQKDEFWSKFGAPEGYRLSCPSLLATSAWVRIRQSSSTTGRIVPTPQ